ncbi:MAG: hypothetical protein K6U08_00140 [Firmicutes bacterium]|nr:hypothetical protein [Bacillota bacterium]
MRPGRGRFRRVTRTGTGRRVGFCASRERRRRTAPARPGGAPALLAAGDVEVLLVEAVQALRAARWEEALAALRTAGRVLPEFSLLRGLEGLALCGLGHYGEALAGLEAAWPEAEEAGWPGLSALITLATALAAARTGRADRALRALDALPPAVAAAVETGALRAEALLALGRHREALAALAELSALSGGPGLHPTK